MQPLVGIIMGSQSDWETMRHAAQTLEELHVPFETRIVSAHRTPDLLFEYAAGAEERGIEVIIAGAGGAAHLPGMTAAKTVVPVLGVPVESHALRGLDSLLSIVQMPAGVPVGTLAIGRAGAVNALHHQALRDVAPGLRVVGCAPDGIIEAVEGTGDTFIVGVQCHPEELWRSAETRWARLFTGFIAHVAA